MGEFSELGRGVRFSGWEWCFRNFFSSRPSNSEDNKFDEIKNLKELASTIR